MARDLATLVAFAHERGLRVNNLFELEADHWQANVRGDIPWKGPYAFGRGGTPEEALTAALHNAVDAQVMDAAGFARLPQPPVVDVFA